MKVLGMMSGTSMDGIDCVLARFEGVPVGGPPSGAGAGEEANASGGSAATGNGFTWDVVARSFTTYESGLRERLGQALSPGTSNVLLLTELHAEIGEAYADLAAAMVADRDVDLIAMAGQTVYHIPRVEPEHGWRVKSTLQLGEATRVLERCGVAVVSDFRQSDISAGGEGAPMVSYGDLVMFHRPGVARSVHNLGGISNLTYLPADGDPSDVIAFDTGPASCIIDEAMERHFSRAFDEDGRIADRGTVDERVLADLLEHPYYALRPPKTTGREVFHYSEASARADLGSLSPEDVVATLTALTAESIARSYRRDVVPRGLEEILVAGGGAHNQVLMQMLRDRLRGTGATVRTFEDLGWNAKDRECVAFALMGYQAWHGRTNTLPSATGARHAVVAGKISRPAPGRSGCDDSSKRHAARRSG